MADINTISLTADNVKIYDRADVRLAAMRGRGKKAPFFPIGRR